MFRVFRRVPGKLAAELSENLGRSFELGARRKPCEHPLVGLANARSGRVAFRLAKKATREARSLRVNELRVEQVETLQRRRRRAALAEVEVAVRPVEELEEGILLEPTLELVDAPALRFVSFAERLVLAIEVRQVVREGMAPARRSIELSAQG